MITTHVWVARYLWACSSSCWRVASSWAGLKHLLCIVHFLKGKTSKEQDWQLALYAAKDCFFHKFELLWNNRQVVLQENNELKDDQAQNSNYTHPNQPPHSIDYTCNGTVKRCIGIGNIEVSNRRDQGIGNIGVSDQQGQDIGNVGDLHMWFSEGQKN